MVVGFQFFAPMRLLTCFALGALVSGWVLSGDVAAKPVDFVTDVKPILELNCVACHNPEHAEENGKYRLTPKRRLSNRTRRTSAFCPAIPMTAKSITSLVAPPE
jgi:hypothetical protein